MTQISQESSCRGWALVLIPVPAPRTYFLVIISTHLHRAEPGQLGPFAPPPHLPAPSTATVPHSSPTGLPARGDGTAWISHSLTAGSGAGQAEPACLPGDGPCLWSDATRWLLKLGKEPSSFPITQPARTWLPLSDLSFDTWNRAENQIFLKRKNVKAAR